MFSTLRQTNVFLSSPENRAFRSDIKLIKKHFQMDLTKCTPQKCFLILLIAA